METPARPKVNPPHAERKGAPAPPPATGRGGALAPWLFLVLLGEALYRSHGHYEPVRIVMVAVGFAVASVAIVTRPASLAPDADRTAIVAILAFQLLTLGGATLLYPSPAAPATVALPYVLAATAALSLGAFALVFGGQRERPLLVTLAALGVLLVVSRVLVLHASPTPQIDVFTIDTAATDFLLAGKNPYTQGYADIYGGRYDYEASFNYFPGLLVWLAPFRVIAKDIRAAFIAAELVFAAALVAIRRPHASRAAALLPACVWLTFPVAWFVLEQSWIDGLLLAALGGIGWALSQRRMTVAAALLGFLLSVKQSAVLAGVLTAAFVAFEIGARGAARFAAVAAGVAAAIVLPLFLAAPGAFWRHTVTKMLAAGPRDDAFCVPTLFRQLTGAAWPEIVSALCNLGALVGLVAWMRRRRGEGAHVWAGAVFIAYGVTFLFAKFAFCNYYYSLAGLGLLYVTLGGGRIEVSSTAGDPRSVAA